MTRWVLIVCVIVVIVSLSSLPLVNASIGENLYPYIYCMSDCLQQTCLRGQYLSYYCCICQFIAARAVNVLNDSNPVLCFGVQVKIIMLRELSINY